MKIFHNNKKSATSATDASMTPGAALVPDPLPGASRPPHIPPSLWQFLKEINNGVKEDEERLVTVLLRDYPTGALPAWGVTMCKLYLREARSEDCGPDDCWLNLVQISADDQSWALNRETQGGVRALISWITGRTGVSLHEEEWYAEMWYRSARVLVREELGRRAISKLP